MMTEQLVELSLAEVREIQIGILDYFKHYCDNHGITYWVDYGTLLGAVRHKGYIPWDDDIDVGVMRSDYENIKKYFNCNPETKYRFICPEYDTDYHFVFGKILDTETVLYEPAVNGKKLAVNIDVFVMDNAPEKQKEIDKIYRKHDLYRYLDNVKNAVYNPNSTVARQTISRILHLLMDLFLSSYPKNYFILKDIKSIRKYEGKVTEKVAHYVTRQQLVYDRKAFIKTTTVEFEGKEYKAPIDYDGWLKTLYGDYMKLPPKEEQVTHHDYIAYRKVKCDENFAD